MPSGASTIQIFTFGHTQFSKNFFGQSNADGMADGSYFSFVKYAVVVHNEIQA